ncbi:MAG: ELM1/GtrOC1 family putative glycosyltransferase [Sphingomicrobium sp.]
MADQKAGGPLRIWAILGARAGDNNQVVALAEALGLPFEIKHLQYNLLHLIGPRLLGRSLASLTRASRDLIRAEPPPDLTISSGHRSVAVVQWLRHRSNRRMRSIHVGFPRVSPGRFDLVIATPQYPIADHRNLLRVPYALTRAATAAPDAADRELLSRLPLPRQLLIVGGPTLYWSLDEQALFGTLQEMLAEAAKDGGSVLVTTSPRTPPSVRNELARMIAASDARTLLGKPGQRPHYSSLLEAADSIRVTADSVAMASDAVWTGKPISLVPVTKSALGRVVVALWGDRRLYPQDLRSFWRVLERMGIGASPALPRTSPRDEMTAVMGRVRPLVDAIDRA